MKKALAYLMMIMGIALMIVVMVWGYINYDWRVSAAALASIFLGMGTYCALEVIFDYDDSDSGAIDDCLETEIRVCTECGKRFELPKACDGWTICPDCGNMLVKEYSDERD